MPKVSVIVPVHNAEPHVRECLESILNQTLVDIEVLCVDDGSTDSTPLILSSLAAEDARVRLLTQQNLGAGAARNAGMELASGDYLAFFDADDLFAPTMLEEMYAKSVVDQADMAICRVQHLDTLTGKLLPANHLLRTNLLPSNIPFSCSDMPSHILNFTANATWNKLFRHSFVAEQGLRFQEIKRTNDLLFTNLALVKASRITVVDKVLVYYRVGHDSNLQSTNDETPLEFYQALLALRDELVGSDVYAAIELSFVNKALSTCLYNLNSLRSLESFYRLYDLLKTECFVELGINDRAESCFFSERDYDQYRRIMNASPELYLFEELLCSRTRLKDLRSRHRESARALKSVKRKLRRVESSRAYRITKRATSVLKRFKGLWPHRSD